jgi:hypothetical protein
MFREFVESHFKLHGRGLLATFWFYGDESGIHDGANWCVVSGYVGRDDHWIAFDDAWKALLKQADVTDFHATEFFGRTEDGKRIGQYALWTDAQAEAYLASLTTLIDDSKLIHPIGRGVHVADFMSLTIGERRFLTGGVFLHGKFRRNTGAPTKPYYLAVIDSVIDATVGTPDGSVVHFLFDRQNVLGAQAINAFNVACKQLETEHPVVAARVGSMAFDDRAKFGGLQAADLLTHLWYCYAESTITGKQVRGDRFDALEVLTQRKPRLAIQNLKAMRHDLDKHLPQDVLAKMRASA